MIFDDCILLENQYTLEDLAMAILTPFKLVKFFFGLRNRTTNPAIGALKSGKKTLDKTTIE